MAIHDVTVGHRATPYDTALAASLTARLRGSPRFRLSLTPIPAPSRGTVDRCMRVLLDGDIDILVMPVVDVPVLRTAGVRMTVPERGDARDAIVGTWPPGQDREDFLVSVATDLHGEQLRRRFGVRYRVQPDPQIRLAVNGLGGITASVVPADYMDQIGHGSHTVTRLDLDTVTPLAGQGAVAVLTRSGDDDTNAVVAPLHHGPTETAIAAERGVQSRFSHGHGVWVAAHARHDPDDQLVLEAVVLTETDYLLTDHTTTPAGGNTAKTAGILADRMRRGLRGHWPIIPNGVH